MPIYLDSSAIVKLVVEERESDALRRVLRGKRDLTSSALARTEVGRVVAAQGPDAVARANDVLSRIELVRISDRVLSLAATLPPHTLRSLDAIHLATARLLENVKLVVTYDARMAEAARALKWKVSAPK